MRRRHRRRRNPGILGLPLTQLALLGGGAYIAVKGWPTIQQQLAQKQQQMQSGKLANGVLVAPSIGQGGVQGKIAI